MRNALLTLVLLVAGPACAQTSNPFPEPIPTHDPIVVGVTDFAVLPDAGNEPTRMMTMVEEPVSGRFFVSGMRGRVFTLDRDGGSVTEYLDVDGPEWGVGVNSSGRERGVQSFTLHPQFAEAGTPGYGRFYVWTDTGNTGPDPDFRPGGGNDSHDTVLLEWRAADASALAYDGGPPRELLRLEQPFGNHNGGQIAFNPGAGPGDADHGLLYVGVADGGSGGDPMGLSQNLGSVFGKILRIDPLGSGSANGQYGIPPGNPFVEVGGGALGEVYVLGVRNPQRFGWDVDTGMLYVADIGQNAIEELSPAPPGANLGWNLWEGSYGYVGRSGVSTRNPRGDPAMTYPVAEYAHGDPLLTNRAASTGVHVYRGGPIEALRDLILFGDFPSGEIFAIDANDPPGGGNGGMRRVLLRPEGEEPTTLLNLVQARSAVLGREAPGRTDLRFGSAAEGRVFLTNKHDGMIRVLKP
ncbi:MAG: PQQ-dependent sugar dehydrogenase [Gemmatimonadota bacterium]|nr:PQQ-dependent sugar dehydrogenase [Gemmatimonadota bacterium]